MFSLHDASRDLKIPVHLPSDALQAAGASIDTRTLQAGELFVAFKGQKADGHDFLEEAFRKGACGALIEAAYFSKRRQELEAKAPVFKNLLVVENASAVLRQLAVWHRSQNKAFGIGITGSVGKTTTKDFLYYLLKLKKRGIATRGNLNNALGVPLTLLRLDQEAEFFVCELGASGPGEIRDLAQMIKPQAGIITGISPAHLDGFGTLEKIYTTKLELFESLAPNSLAIVPDRDMELLKRASYYPLKILRAGEKRDADYHISEVRSEDGWVCFTLNQKYHFRFPGEAQFLAGNAALALAMAERFGLDLAEIPESWHDLELSRGRFQIRTLSQGIRLVDDTYNASPMSFHRALESFQAMQTTGRKILVIADMLELGERARSYHELLGEEIAGYTFDGVVAYGTWTDYSLERIRELKPSLTVKKVKDAAAAARFLETYLRAGDDVLLKGSHSMQVGSVLSLLSAPSVSMAAH